MACFADVRHQPWVYMLAKTTLFLVSISDLPVSEYVVTPVAPGLMT